MKTRKVKIRKFLCLFLMALAVFAFSGCGGSTSNNFVSPNTQSEDVTPTPTPTSPDVTPTPTPTPTSPDVTPTPTPTSPDVTPTPTPTSPDVTGEETAVVDTTLNVNDSATASNILSAVNAGAGTAVAALPEESVGAERTLDDVSDEDLAEIPSDETPAVVLPLMTVNNSAVYVWGVDLSGLKSGDNIFMHMMPDSSVQASGFFAAAESDSYAFLDDAGSKITRVPASKRVNVAAYMEAGISYAPIITTSKQDSSSDSDTPSVPVVPVPPTSTDVTPIVEPTSPDVAPTTSPDVQPAPTSGDNRPTPPTSGDTRPELPDGPMSGDTPPDAPSGPASGDTPPDAPTSGDTQQDTTDPTDSETVTGETYTSSTAFENALLINGAASTYTNITVTKTGDASGQSENYDWYGTNAAVLAQGGADVTISGSSTSISSNAVGGNAVFAYGGNSSMNTNNSGDGTKITISDATITTQSNNSGGIMVTGGGIIEANNLTVTTASGSSAAIRSDRGGGTITATGGSYTTNGVGSPAIYSTAAISVYNADLTSNVAQVVVIEGGNSVTLDNDTLTANHTQRNGQDTSYQAVLIYQSQSGDASSGSSSFTMKDSTLTNANGDIFHVTNTTTTITLSGSAITNNDESGNFLDASSDSWGSSGSNGGKVTLNADGQTIDGNMIVDSVSSLSLNMSNSSNFNGAINTTGTAGSVSVVIDATSTWTLTGNSYVSSLTNNSGTLNTNGYTLYVNGVAYSNN